MTGSLFSLRACCETLKLGLYMKKYVRLNLAKKSSVDIVCKCSFPTLAFVVNPYHVKRVIA